MFLVQSIHVRPHNWLQVSGDSFGKRNDSYYEPETGRYVSPDPVGLAGGLNVYGYVENDPISWIDFNGLARNRGGGNPKSIALNPGNRPGGWSYGRFCLSIDNAPPRTANYPVGSSRSQFQVLPKAQQPGGNVCGRNFSGHAFDLMQARGIPPSVVNNTITTGSEYLGKTSSTSQYYSVVINVTIVVNHNTGNTVSVRWGLPSGLRRTMED